MQPTAIFAGALMLAFGGGEACGQTAPADNRPPLPSSQPPNETKRDRPPVLANPANPQDTVQSADSTQQGAADIVVTGTRPTVRRGPGVTEYGVTDNLQGTTGTIADLLNTLPSVSVTSDGELSVRGRTDVQVLIDGRPSASMSGASRATILQTLSGSSLKSVEVITNPSAGLESGGATVVNLKLKRNETLSPHASVAADIDHRRRGRVLLDTSYDAEDVTLDFDASYREDLRADGAFTTRSYSQVPPGGIALSTIQAYYVPTRSRAGDVHAKLRYQITSLADIEGSGHYTSFTAANVVRFFTEDSSSPGDVLDRYLRKRESRLTKENFDANLSLTRRGIGTDGQLVVEALYGSGNGRSNRTYSLTPDGVNAPVNLTYVGDYQDSTFYRATADYKGGLAGRLSLKAGVVWESAAERFRNGNEDLPLNASLPLRFPGIPQDFRVGRDKLSGYLEATMRRPNWLVQGGLKWRNSKFDLRDGSARTFLSRRFDGLDASFSVEHDLSEGKVSLSLSRLLQLPEALDLNPTVVLVDIQDRYVGNPNLRPQKPIRGEVNYQRTINKLDVATSLYYRATEDTIANVYQAIGNNVISGSKVNVGLTQEYGAELAASGKLVRALTLSISGNAYRATSSVSPKNSLVTYNAKAALDWLVSNKDKLRLDARAEGPSLLVQGRRSGSRAVSLVWKHTIKTDLSLTLAAQQFLQNSYITTEIVSPTVTTINRRVNDTTSFQLGLKYTIK